jgi:hypothetical protein
VNPLTKWFDRLVKNKMGGPAIGVALISVSLVILAGTQAIPDRWVDAAAWVGILLLWFGAALFSLTSAVLAFQWARSALKSKK